MTKFLTVMTVFVLFGVNSFAQTKLADQLKRYQELDEAGAEYAKAISMMETVYQDGFKANIQTANTVNLQAQQAVSTKATAFCSSIRSDLESNKPEFFSQKFKWKSNLVEKAKAQLGTPDQAQAKFIEDYANLRFCRALLSLSRDSIRASISN